MNLEFEQAYRNLNPEQLEAVEAIDGPVLVVAGPGTGKTQLLSTRVANILKQTDTDPSQILCLTYTNKAAVNMKERIIRLCGPAGARLPVRTFHSFAGEIMNMYPDHFWNGARLKVAPDTVQLETIESILGELPLKSPLALKFSGQYTVVQDIKSAINLTKDAGLTPDKLKAIIDFNRAYIDTIEADMVAALDDRLNIKKLDGLLDSVRNIHVQEADESLFPLRSLSSVITNQLEVAIEADTAIGKTMHTGKFKRDWVQVEQGIKGMHAERRRNDWWYELADVYATYIERMHTAGYYDYADMLVAVNVTLETNPDILADLQERYAYVLIDEFQDSTPAQFRLAHFVADYHTQAGNPNLMAVGDDDQTIFKFSGAELNNMLKFKERYKTAKLVVLTKNYRSTQTILDTSKSVIEQAQSRLVDIDKTLDKRLTAENPPLEPGSIRTLDFASRELELSTIAHEVKHTATNGRRVAILARSNESLLKMAGLLQSSNVPMRYDLQSNILTLDMVQQLFGLMRYVRAVQEGDMTGCNALIHRIIRHPMWAIDTSTLWQMAIDNFKQPNWHEAMLKSSDENLQAIANWVQWLASVSESQQLAVTLEYLIGLRRTREFASPVRNYYLEDNGDGAHYYFLNLSAVQLLRSLVHDFAGAREPTLDEFVRFIDINISNNRIIADESPFVTGTHAVELLTVHKSKGLEFDDVYVIDVTEDNWKPRSGNRKPPANLPLIPALEDTDDYIRLLYVAMTRAKANLTICAYYQNHAGKDVSLSPIVQSVLKVKRISETDEKLLIPVLEENLRWPDLNRGDELAMLATKLETYSLNVTHLINFMNLERGGPQHFKEKNLLRLPEAKSVSAAYGTAIHGALEFAQITTNRDRFSLIETIAEFDKLLREQDLTNAEHGRFAHEGKDLLTRLFEQYDLTLTKGGLPEQDLTAVHLGDAVIRGKLDRIDTTGQHLIITDYKTGKPLRSFDTKDKNQAVKAYNHKLQLIFYAILAKNHARFKNYDQVSGTMLYVAADEAKYLSRSYVPSAEDIDRISKLIKAVYMKIMALDFPDISSYADGIDGILEFERALIEGL